MDNKKKSSGQFDWVNGRNSGRGDAGEQKTVKQKRELPAFSLSQLFPKQEPYPILDNGVLILVSGLLYLFFANGFGRIASSIFLAIVCCSFVWRSKKRAFGLLAFMFLTDFVWILFRGMVLGSIGMGLQMLPGTILSWIILTAAFLLPGFLPVTERIKPWCSLAILAVWNVCSFLFSMMSMAAYAPEKNMLIVNCVLKLVQLAAVGIVIFLITRKKLPAEKQAEFDAAFEETKKVTKDKLEDLLGAGAGIVSTVTEKAGEAAGKASKSARELEKKYKDKKQNDSNPEPEDSKKEEDSTEAVPSSFCPVCGHPLDGTEKRCPACNQPLDFE